MKTPRILTLLRALGALTLLAALPLHTAPPPGILNHQGRIVVSGNNYTGTGHFKFALVDAAGTATLWSNNNSSTGGGQPTAAVPVSVSQGHYALGLGDTALNSADTPNPVGGVLLKRCRSGDRRTLRRRTLARKFCGLSCDSSRGVWRANTVTDK